MGCDSPVRQGGVGGFRLTCRMGQRWAPVLDSEAVLALRARPVRSSGVGCLALGAPMGRPVVAVRDRIRARPRIIIAWFTGSSGAGHAAILRGMTTEAYIPTEVTFDGRAVGEVFALTLHDPDSDSPHGALTTHQPLAEGARGALIVIGTRDGGMWRITLDEIEVCRQTAVGCEFTIFSGTTRERIGDAS